MTSKLFKENLSLSRFAFNRIRGCKSKRYFYRWHKDRNQCQSLRLCMGMSTTFMCMKGKTTTYKTDSLHHINQPY